MVKIVENNKKNIQEVINQEIIDFNHKYFLNETILPKQNKINIIKDFIKYSIKELGITEKPKIILNDKNNLSRELKSFGGYMPNENKIMVIISNRNLADVLRTIAHELVHHKQRLDNKLQDNSGETGSSEENEANAIAGVLMRNYGKINPNIFE